MNYKRCADSREWLENKQQTNSIHCDCERHDVEWALEYLKQTHLYKMTAVKVKPPGKSDIYLYVSIL